MNNTVEVDDEQVLAERIRALAQSYDEAANDTLRDVLAALAVALRDLATHLD